MKIDLELSDKPEVHAIAGMLNIDPDAVVGKLLRVWQWFDKHTTDGNAHGVTYSLPDRIVGVTGFGEAMAFVGWLEQHDKTLVMPNFDRHTSASAKKRASTAKRVADHKAKSNAKGNAGSVSDALPSELPREEKRRYIKPMGDSPELFDKFWKAYPKKKAKGAAEKAWAKIPNRADTLTLILNALAWQTASPEWKKDGGQFIKHPATYLNDKGWLDEPETSPQVAAIPFDREAYEADKKAALARMREEDAKYTVPPLRLQA